MKHCYDLIIIIPEEQKDWPILLLRLLVDVGEHLVGQGCAGP